MLKKLIGLVEKCHIEVLTVNLLEVSGDLGLELTYLHLSECEKKYLQKIKAT